MWVADQNANNVTKLSPTGAALGIFAVGHVPVVAACDGAHVRAANFGSNTVTEL
jgi:hypothetical protein